MIIKVTNLWFRCTDVFLDNKVYRSTVKYPACGNVFNHNIWGFITNNMYQSGCKTVLKYIIIIVILSEGHL